MKASEHLGTRWSMGLALVVALPFLVRGGFLEAAGLAALYVAAYGAGYDLAEKNANANANTKTEEES